MGVADHRGVGGAGGRGGGGGPGRDWDPNITAKSHDRTVKRGERMELTRWVPFLTKEKNSIEGNRAR